MNHVQYVCVFARATGLRLVAAERLVCSLPGLLGPALVELDLLYRTSSQDLLVKLGFVPESFSEALRARLAFWTARAGGRAFAMSGLAERDRRAFQLHVVECELKLTAVEPDALFEAAGPFFTEAGAPASRRRWVIERPMLVVEPGGPGWNGLAYQPLLRELFLPSPMAPPPGDEVMLVVRSAGVEKPVGVRTQVSGQRSAEEAGPGRPAGFSLRIPDSAPSVRALLEQHSPTSTSSARGAPRYAVQAPATVGPGAAVDAPPPTPASPGMTIIYATAQELRAAFIENLSQGGAFVRSATPFPAGSPLALQFRLPNGAELRTQAVVAFVSRDGMGVRFTLDADGEATMQAAMAHLTARPSRAAVVNDDGPFRHQLAEALIERGFEVVGAPLSGDGLRLVSEELRGLDLLLTDVAMPGRGGEVFVRTLRAAGADSGLTIVVAASKMSAELERRFEAAGADAVLDTALGPELLAQAADAVLERKRLARAAG
jgi:CheY-like chemotaxis protein/Tfp pilus assembly protein PilZ